MSETDKTAEPDPPTITLIVDWTGPPNRPPERLVVVPDDPDDHARLEEIGCGEPHRYRVGSVWFAIMVGACARAGVRLILAHDLPPRGTAADFVLSIPNITDPTILEILEDLSR